MATILIYNINEPYIHQGGMERVTDSLIRMLQQLGHRVSVLCRYHNRMNAPYQCPCDIHYLPTNESSSSYYEQLLDTVRPDIVIDQEEGVGVAFLPDYVTEEALAQGSICRLSVPDIQVEVWKQILYRRDKWMSAPMRAMLSHLTPVRLAGN